MKNKFKVGDRVIGNEKATRYCTAREGWVGYVVQVIGERYIRVNEDKNGGPESLKSWFVLAECFRPYPEHNNKIVITTDGKTTLARLYEDNKVIRRAEAKCSPDDTFDFTTGVKLAFDRLMGREAKPEKLPCVYKPGMRVRVTGNTCCHGYRVGQILTLDECVWHPKTFKGFITESDFEPAPAGPAKPAKKLRSTVGSCCDCGVCGTATNYRDAVGRPLEVGDVVELFLAGESRGSCFVVKGDGGPFIMGIRSDCCPETGDIGGWKLVLRKKWTNTYVGEKLGAVIVEE